MSRLAQSAIQKKAYDEQQKKLQEEADKQAKVAASGDARPIANKIFDALNPADSGRSFTTATPSEKGKKQNTKSQLGDAAKGLFSGANKTVQSVNAITGYSEKRDNQGDDKHQQAISAINDKYKDVPDGDPKLRQMYAEKKKENDRYQQELKKRQDDTKWAGTKDKGFGDRLKKAAGTSAETVSEFLPVGKGAQAAKLAEQGALDIAKAGGEQIVKKGVQEVAEQGAKKLATEGVEDAAKTGISRMARAKLAAKVGTQQAAVGAVGGAGGAASEDGSSLKDVVQQALTGGVMGGVLGASGTMLPSLRRKLPDEVHAPTETITPNEGAAALTEAPASLSDRAQVALGSKEPAYAPSFQRNEVLGEAPKSFTDNLVKVDEVKPNLDEPTFIRNNPKLGKELERSNAANEYDAQTYRENYKPAASGVMQSKSKRIQDALVDAHKSADKSDSLSLTSQALADTDNSKTIGDILGNFVPHIKGKDKRDLIEAIAKVNTPEEVEKLVYSHDPTNLKKIEYGDGLSDVPDAIDPSIEEPAPVDKFSSDPELADAPAYMRRLPTVSEATTPAEKAQVALASVDGQSASISAPVVVRKGVGGAANPSEIAPPTLESLGETAPAPQRNVTMNADVEGGGETLVAPIRMKILNDLQGEADVRGGRGYSTGVSQATETKTQKGAQYIVDDIEKLQKDTGIDVEQVDRNVAAKLTGETTRSNFQEFRDKMGRNFQDTLTYGARTLGKTGSDFVYDMLQGNKFKRDALDALRENMTKLGSLNKALAGKSVSAKRDLGARIGQALDDRANADEFLKTPKEKELFDQYVTVFDYVKQLREKSGLEVLDNYRPWVDMKNAAEPPMWLAENVTNKRTQTLSRFSKERTKTEAGTNVDNNLADMIYGYVNSQLNEMAYDAPVKKLKGGIENLSAGNKANVGAMNDGIDYMRELVQQAVNPARKNPLERIAGKLTSNVYGSVLPFNIRLGLQNKTQQFVANSRVSKGARSLAKKLTEADAKELEGGLVFGDTTVYGQLEDVNPGKAVKKGIGQKLAKIDPYQKSEHTNVITSYHKGAMQAVLDSDQYKAIRKTGLKPIDAVREALKDPAVKEAAIRRGNVVVNDTQFGASPLARPEMLREEGSIWGVLPKKTVYMFTRFPIGMSQHTLEVLDGKSTRALEMLKNGDPRAVSVAEMRTNYNALLSSMKDAKVAIKGGTDIGIPEDVLNKQIETVGKNLKIIDTEAKKLSQIRGGKTIKNLGKMWAAAAAIQIIFDGGIQNFADDPAGTTGDALAKTNPTASNKVVGSYSPLASITSSASPLDKYGNLNTRAITNYVPGVGLAVNRGRDIKKLVESLTGSNDSSQ